MEFSAPIRVFRSSIARPTDTPIYASTSTSRCLLQDLGPRWIRSLLSCRVGIELECADFRRRVTSPALSVTEWVPSSAMATFLQAPLRSRTVGFPESGSDLGSTTHLAFPMPEALKCSVHIHATIHRFAKRARSCCEDGLTSALCPRTTLERPSAQSPFAQRRFPNVRELSCISSKGVTPSS